MCLKDSSESSSESDSCIATTSLEDDSGSVSEACNLEDATSSGNVRQVLIMAATADSSNRVDEETCRVCIRRFQDDKIQL